MGRKGGGQTEAQVLAEKRKEEEYQQLQAIETQKTRAAGRRTRGRASLISGSEQGVGDSGFGALNQATKERLGVEAENKRLADIETKRKAALAAQTKISSWNTM